MEVGSFMSNRDMTTAGLVHEHDCLSMPQNRIPFQDKCAMTHTLRQKRSRNLLQSAVKRLRRAERLRSAAEASFFGSRRIAWLNRCNATHAEVLLSLNDGGDDSSDDSEAEEDDGSGRRLRSRRRRNVWSSIARFATCWPSIILESECSDSGDECVDEGQQNEHQRWRRLPHGCAHSMFAQRHFGDEVESPTTSPISTPIDPCSEASEVEEDNTSPTSLPRHRPSLKAFESLVDAVAPWGSLSGSWGNKHSSEDGLDASPIGTVAIAKRFVGQMTQETFQVASAASGALRRKASAEAQKFSLEPSHASQEQCHDSWGRGVDEVFWLAPSARANYVVVSADSAGKWNHASSDDYLEAPPSGVSGIRGSAETFACARRRVEQMTHETLQVASAASDALRRKASAEVLRFTLDPSHAAQEQSQLSYRRGAEEIFWMAPSTRTNYVWLSADASFECLDHAISPPTAVAKFAKLASQEALKASKESIKASRMATMSSKLWQEAPDLAKMSSKLATLSTGLAHRLGLHGSVDGAEPCGCGIDEAASQKIPEPPHQGNTLQCYMLFASPLCIERLVIVRLALQCNPSPAAAREEVSSWGLSFEDLRPHIVFNIHPDGRMGVWCAQQRHIEEMVRPGDELLHLSLVGLNGAGVLARGRPLEALLEEVLSHASAQPFSGGLRCLQVELVFRALRALPPLRIGEEIAAVRESGCEVVPCVATVPNIRALVAGAGCRILHMSLHCAVAEPHLLFLEDGSGKAHMVRSCELQDLLGRGQQEQQIHIAFLNACHSYSIGVDLVAVGVRHVICVRDGDEVRDVSCRLFARDFFSALRAGRKVHEAFECGVAILACSQDVHLRGDAQAFVLLPRGGDHRHVYFPGGASRSAAPPPSEGGSWGTVPPPVEDFVGREIDIHHLLQHLRSRRFVEVHGEAGIGKSALLAEVGRFIHLRGEPFDEVRWIDGEDEILCGVCQEGAVALLERLARDPQRRVLLLVDDESVFAWAPLRPLLRFEGVHVLVAATMPTSRAEARFFAQMSDIVSPGTVAMAAGLKPVRFVLRSLEPLAQARLFLRRASRPLYASDFRRQSVEEDDKLKDDMVAPQLPHKELSALAQTPRMRELGGNPRCIIAAARGLDSLERSISSASDSSCSLPSTPRASTGNGLRRVRLVRLSDGRARDEWLRRETRIAQVLEEHTPRALRGAAEIVVMGCRAHPDAMLEDFPDDEALGLLVLGLRARSEDDW